MSGRTLKDVSSVEGSETETGAVRALDEVLPTTNTPESPIEEASPEEMSPALSLPVSPPEPEPKRTKRLIIPCGMPPGLVPSGSEEELAAKLRKRLAKVEQEGLVLLKSQAPSLADARAFSAEEAKAARLPKWGQSTAQLLYASKRHSWFDFEVHQSGVDLTTVALSPMERDTLVDARPTQASRPRPPVLQGCNSPGNSPGNGVDSLDGLNFVRQSSREPTPVALNSFGLLKPPESHPSTPLSLCKPELARPLCLGEDKDGVDKVPELSWTAWLKRLLAFTGPGWLMSIAYVDPGNLEADLQIGAQFGYSLLWALFGSTAVGLGMQLVAARLGCATKRHLAEHCRDAFSRPLRLFLWALTEMAIIGSDIQEVIGCSIGLELLAGLSLAEGVLVTAFAAFIFLFLERLGTRPLELFFGVLILVLALSMGRLFIVISPDDLAVLEGLMIPQLPNNALQQVVGMVGCVIMPHNLFLHSALVQSRVIQSGEEEGRQKPLWQAIRLFTVESTAAIITSLVINTFVVAVFAKGFYGKPGTEGIGLANAGSYLGDAFGNAMRVVWALGLCAAGQSSTMTGAYAGQWVMQGYLQLQVAPWKRALITRSMALVPCLLVAIYFRDRRDGLDVLNGYLNILQSVVLPFAAIPLLSFAGSYRIMGRLALSKAAMGSAWLAMSMTIGANMYLALQQLEGQSWILTTLVCSIYFGAVVLVFVKAQKFAGG
eukprot:s146_g27.t1